MIRTGMALALLAALPLAAGAADTKAAPLRHMVFGVTVGINNRGNQQGSGIGTDIGTRQSFDRTQGVGIMTADVIQPTADGGLIIDISEEAQDRKEPVQRVGVYSDGSLKIFPNAAVNEEERILLRYLARNIIAIANPVKGSSWNYDLDQDGTKIHTGFRVLDSRSDGTIDIDIDENMSITGKGSPTSGTAHGVLTYDTKNVVPAKIDYTQHIRQEGAVGNGTIDLTFIANLREDSFSKK